MWYTSLTDYDRNRLLQKHLKEIRYCRMYRNPDDELNEIFVFDFFFCAYSIPFSFSSYHECILEILSKFYFYLILILLIKYLSIFLLLL